MNTKQISEVQNPFGHIQFPADSGWGKPGKLTGKLAAKHDAKSRYVTASLPKAITNSLIPANHGLAHGNHIASFVEGCFTIWKINRANLATIAAHLHPTLKMPNCIEGVFQSETYDTVFLGPLTGFQVTKTDDLSSVQISATEKSHEQGTVTRAASSVDACIEDADAPLADSALNAILNQPLSPFLLAVLHKGLAGEGKHE